MTTDPHEELAGQYTLGRAEHPDMDAEDLAKLITSRLGPEGRRCLIEAELQNVADAANQASPALEIVRRFIYEMEEMDEDGDE